MPITTFQSAFQNPKASTLSDIPTKQVIPLQPPIKETKDTLIFGNSSPSSLIVIDPANTTQDTKEDFCQNVIRIWKRRKQIGRVRDLPIQETNDRVSWDPDKVYEFEITRPSEGIFEVYSINDTGRIRLTAFPLKEMEGLSALEICLLIAKHQVESSITTLSHEQIDRLLGAMNAVFNHEST